jgi:hypothetical protein
MLLYAEHVRLLEGEGPFHNLMSRLQCTLSICEYRWPQVCNTFIFLCELRPERRASVLWTKPAKPLVPESARRYVPASIAVIRMPHVHDGARTNSSRVLEEFDVYVGKETFTLSTRERIFLHRFKPHAFIIRSPQLRMLSPLSLYPGAGSTRL